VPEPAESLVLGGQAQSQGLGGDQVILGQEVVRDAVQRQVQDAAVGPLFQNREVPLKGRYQAALASAPCLRSAADGLGAASGIAAPRRAC
jgi:hypothetical protein